jgi:hypothetical protein
MQYPFREEIISLDLTNGQVEEFAKLPTSLAAHTSFLIDDRYIVVYGGTNGLKFFDCVLRYDIEQSKWTMMTGYPESQKGSPFFKDGHFACVSASSPGDSDDQIWIVFGGCTQQGDCNDFMVLHKSHLVDDKNFSEISVIM